MPTADAEEREAEDSKKQKRDEREKLRKEIDQLEELGLSEDHEAIVSRRRRLQELARHRPMATQILECDHKLKSAQDKLDKRKAAAEAAISEMARLQEILQTAVDE